MLIFQSSHYYNCEKGIIPRRQHLVPLLKTAHCFQTSYPQAPESLALGSVFDYYIIFCHHFGHVSVLVPNFHDSLIPTIYGVLCCRLPFLGRPLDLVELLKCLNSKSTLSEHRLLFFSNLDMLKNLQFVLNVNSQCLPPTDALRF